MMFKRVTTPIFSSVVCAVLALGVSVTPARAHWDPPTSVGNNFLSEPIGVAVEQSTGSIYVGNRVPPGYIDEFDVSHSLVAPPSPFGSSFYSGVAVDPANHDVYVVEAIGQEIQSYDPLSGDLLSSFSIAGSANLFGLFTTVQIASDDTGNVYVPFAPSNEVQVFDPSGGTPGGISSPITGSGTNALSEPTGVAVDPSGDVWVADTGNGRIEEFEPDGAFVMQITSPGVHAVAVDGATGDVFASVFGGPGPRVIEYDHTGTQIEEFGLSTIGESGLETPNAIAFDETRNIVYVADGGNNVVWAFVQAPEVTTGQASGVQQSNATISGHIDPAGNGDVTSCKFEYGTSTSYGHTVPCMQPTPYASAVDVSAELSNLSPDTTYHYRLVATNTDSAGQGKDETFTTPGPPVIDSESSTDAITTTANVDVQVNPFGHDTTCQLQYVDDASFQASGYAGAIAQPCDPQDLGHGFGDQSASVKLSGLQIGTVYHYHFVVVNQAGAVTGEDQTFATFGVKSFSLGVLGQDAQPYTQAGGHPYEMVTSFALNTTTVPGGRISSTDANPKDIRTELPPGLIGNPDATPKCAPYDVAHAACSGQTQIGILTVYTPAGQGGIKSTESPIYNLVPPSGFAAQFGARFNGYVTAHIDAKVRTGGDYGVTADALYVSAAEGLIGATVRLWGVPADESHDPERYCPHPGTTNEQREVESGSPCPGGAPLVPFLTNPTSCSDSPLTSMLSADSWQDPGAFVHTGSEMSGMTGCDRPNFTPSITVQPESSGTDSSTGLKVDLHIPQNNNPAGISEAELKDAVVTLPEGMTVNPSSASGLEACSPGQVELHGPQPAECPDASKIGKVEIKTPLLDHSLTGSVYLATPYENPFGSLLAIYIAVNDPISGVVVKLAGHVETNPVTGQLTTRFAQNPQLPFEDLKVELFGGPRASLKTPDSCGLFTASTDMTPWTSPAEPDATPSSAFSIGQGCGAHGFAPSFAAGTSNNQAGAYSPFTMTLSRSDQDQAFNGVTLQTPPGLLGVLKTVPLCGEPQAAQGTCSSVSQIGHTTVGAGVGNEPVFLPQAGRLEDPVFLTGPYDGAPFGLSIVEHAEAGPFNLGPEGGKPIIVRAAISVDPHTAQITVVSNELPHILQGVPLQVRTINVVIDRSGFIFNPTNCSPLSVGGTITSTQNTSTGVSSPFQGANCASLPFKPGFAASTAGRTSKANGASLTVKVTSKGGPQAGGGEANIAKVRVTLPKQLPARLTTLQKACTEAQFNTNPAGCPEASLVGTATAITPVLANPVSGPAYLVSHGGAAFPDLVFILQGEGITLYLDGNTNIKKGITTSTFNSVPDAPISSFVTTFPQGPHSVLATDIPVKAKNSMCAQALTMPTTLTAQNGAVIGQTTKIGVTGCPKAKKKAKAKTKKTKHARKGGKKK